MYLTKWFNGVEFQELLVLAICFNEFLPLIISLEQLSSLCVRRDFGNLKLQIWNRSDCQNSFISFSPTLTIQVQILNLVNWTYEASLRKLLNYSKIVKLINSVHISPIDSVKFTYCSTIIFYIISSAEIRIPVYILVGCLILPNFWYG